MRLISQSLRPVRSTSANDEGCRRDRLALGALRWFQAMPGNGQYSFRRDADVQALMVDMLTALLHYAKACGFDTEAIIKSAAGRLDEPPRLPVKNPADSFAGRR